VGTFAAQEAAESAQEWLEKQGIGPTTVESDAEGVWAVHAPADRKAEALEQLQILERRRSGPGI